MPKTRVILIGGPSSVGKSALARSMASKLEWRCTSTDHLARHPGRPWKTSTRAVPEHVAVHYLSLTVDALITDVMRHFETMWAGIEALVRTHATDLSTDPLIIEGSAVWPERAAAMDLDNVAAFWLTASSQLLEARIRAASRYDEGTADERAMVEKFLGRNDRYNDLMMEAVNRLGLVSIDVGVVSSVDELTEHGLQLVAR